MPLRVVHVNTADFVGGAAIAAYRLHEALNRMPDVESSLLAGIRVTNDPRVTSVCRNRHEYLLSRFAHRLQSAIGLAGWYSPHRALERHPLIRAADVVHLHHISGGFFSYKEMIGLSQLVPLVWTLHDMWGFTGACHQALDCRRWEGGCGACPNLPSDAMLDLSGWHWRRKRDVYRLARLTIVTPSRWLMSLSKQSPLMGHLAVRCVPNAIDTGVFKPAAERNELRRRWGIPQDAQMVMIGSADLGNEQKGAGQLLRVLCGLPPELRARMALLLVGKGSFPEIGESFGGRVIPTGYIGSQEQMAQCYSMADLFLLPTRADNLPNTLIESLACGTPAITFDVGGCGEVVRHLETGYLARAGDYDDFAAGVELMLKDALLYEKVKAGCRGYAVERYSSDKVAERHAELYRRIVTQR